MSNIEMPALKLIKNSTTNILNNTRNYQFGCVIMASGLGKRFGGNKLMADLGGKPLIQWILDTTRDLFDYRIVVTRSLEVKELCEKNNIDVILHSMPGRNDTVRLGLEQIESKVDFCFFTPADQPFIKRESFIKLINAAQKCQDLMVRTVYGEQVGAPICFPKWTFSELLKLPEGKGGGAVVKKYLDKVSYVQVASQEELNDIDTLEDLQKAKDNLNNFTGG